MWHFHHCLFININIVRLYEQREWVNICSNYLYFRATNDHAQQRTNSLDFNLAQFCCHCCSYLLTFSSSLCSWHMLSWHDLPCSFAIHHIGPTQTLNQPTYDNIYLHDHNLDHWRCLVFFIGNLFTNTVHPHSGHLRWHWMDWKRVGIQCRWYFNRILH